MSVDEKHRLAIRAEAIIEASEEFERGYICACENIVVMFDEPTIAEEVLKQASLTDAQIRTLMKHFKSKR